MDNDNSNIEEQLKKLSPLKPSHGTRWNLEQRLADMDPPSRSVKALPRQPIVLIMSIAAALLFVALIWSILPQTDKTPASADNLPVNVVVAPNKPAVDAPPAGPELIGDAEDVPSVVSVKKHITDMQDIGIVDDENEIPVRRVRQEYVNELKVRDPKTGKIYRIQKPGAETIYIRLKDY